MNFDYASIDPRLEILAYLVKPYLEKIGESHGWSHSLEITEFYLIIGMEEKVDLRIGLAAGLVHDIGLLFGTHDNHGILGSLMIDYFLKIAGYKNYERAQIKHCMATHNFRYEGLEPISGEAKVLVDSDTRCKIGKRSIERAHKHMVETGTNKKDWARRWTDSRAGLIKKDKIWLTKTGRKMYDDLLRETFGYWEREAEKD